MPFVRVAFFPRANSADFGELADLIPAEVPAGRLLFAAGPARGGWQVVQVWESRVLLDAFNRDVLIPAIGRLNGEPAVWVPTEIVDFEPTQLSLPSGEAY